MQVNGRPATAGQLRALALTNYGVFTTFLVEPAGVRGYRFHLRRLVDDTRAVFGVRLDEGRVDHDVRPFLADLARPVTVRVTAFSAALDLAAPDRVDEVDLLVTARPAGAGPVRPLRLGSVPFVRGPAGVKHTGLFGQLHARRQARLAGHDDALVGLNSRAQVYPVIEGWLRGRIPDPLYSGHRHKAQLRFGISRGETTSIG